jgi:hypothetical protein
MLTVPGSRYCYSHASHAKLDAASLAAELSIAAASLASPEDVHRVLAKIFLALCDDRISLKKAGTLSYIAQMLLRAHREIAVHKKLQEDRDEKEELKRQEMDGSQFVSSWIVPDCVRPDELEPAATTANSSLTAVAAGPQASTSPKLATDPSGIPGSPNPDQGDPAGAQTNNNGNEHNRLGSSAETAPKSQRSAVQNKQRIVPQTPALPDLNHFHPIDFNLPPGLQDHRRNIPPPDAEEIRRRELRRRYCSTRGRPW